VLSALREVCATCEDALNEAGGDYISFELQPEYVLKLRKRTPLVTLGLNLETHAQGYELVAKRGTQDLPLWKARATAEEALRCHCRPLTRANNPSLCAASWPRRTGEKCASTGARVALAPALARHAACGPWREGVLPSAPLP
jgi:hypothetical protein